jgi:hypothetical protein
MPAFGLAPWTGHILKVHAPGPDLYERKYSYDSSVTAGVEKVPAVTYKKGYNVFEFNGYS